MKVTHEDLQQYQARKRIIRAMEKFAKIPDQELPPSAQESEDMQRWIDEIKARNNAVELFISGLEDPLLKQLCEYRYLKGYTWQQTAVAVYRRWDVAPATPRNFVARNLRKLGIE